MQNQKIYILKHKDYDVALLNLDTKEGALLDCFIYDVNRMPFGGANDPRAIYAWWNDRAIPEGRSHLEEMLKKYDCKSSPEFLLKNLGLSLTDSYWICPKDILNLRWNDVNLFDHGNDVLSFHSPDGRVHYSSSKNAALGGNLDKFAIRKSDTWYLEKYTSAQYPDNIQNVNELFATKFHEMQGFKEYVPYTLYDNDGIKNQLCECPFFTNKNIELLTAFELTQGYNYKEIKDIKEEVNQFINICNNKGLDRNYVQYFMDYMISSDFILSNTDRHWGNFGVLRDPDTLDLFSMAPIYDNGNSMFYNSPYTTSRLSLLYIKDNFSNIYTYEKLKIVENKNIIDEDAIPSPSYVKDFYIENGVREELADKISATYSNNLDLYMEDRRHITIMPSKEIEYIEPPSELLGY